MKKTGTINQTVNNDEMDFSVELNWESQSGNMETLTYSGADIVNELDYQYGFMHFFYNNSASLSIQELWSRYVHLNKTNWNTIAKAFFAEYNPIYNYSMFEKAEDTTEDDVIDDETNTHSITKDGETFTKEVNILRTSEITTDDVNISSVKDKDKVRRGVKDVNDPNDTGTLVEKITYGKNTTTTELPTNNKTSNYTTTYDNSSQDRLETYQTTQSKSDIEDRGIDTTTTTDKSSEDTFIGDRASGSKTKYRGEETSQTKNNTIEKTTTYNHNLTREGNIGVTTSAQMITQELELRIYNLFYEIVKGFVERYCFYLESEEFID